MTLPKPALRIAFPLLVVAAWQAGVSFGLLDKFKFSSPLGIAQAFVQLNHEGVLWPSIAISITRAVVGLGIGGVTGLGLGVAVGLNRQAETVLDASFQMIRTLPHLALVPLFLIWFGLGEAPKIALVAVGSFFPLYLNTFKAVRGIEPRLLELAKVQRLGPMMLLREIIMPGALPGILVGLRYALGTAWVSLIVAEQINAQSGVGFLTMQARMFAETSVIMACLVIYAAVGIAADLLVRLIEGLSLSWHPSTSH